MGPLAHALPHLFGRRSHAQATGLLEQRRLCERRATKRTGGQRLARRSSRCDHFLGIWGTPVLRGLGFGGSAARHRAWRVTGEDDLAGRT